MRRRRWAGSTSGPGRWCRRCIPRPPSCADADGQYRSGRNYARADNPTYDQAEAVLASLENGAAAMLFASGMAAATAVFLALKPGDHVVVSKVMYWSLRSCC
ncbi:MAG: PLP-dependent transferase [Rhizomicrobium sp.]